MFSLLCSDPRLGAEAFTVLRPFYSNVSGEMTPLRTDAFPCTGLIHPAGFAELSLLPEEYRAEEVLVVFTPFALSLGAHDPSSGLLTAPDELLRGGVRYRLIRLRDWSSFGYYQGWAVRQKGE